MKSRDSMVLYRSFYDAIKLLPDDIQLEIFKAIFEFGLDGIEPELSKSALPFWLLIKPNLQANRTKWESGSKAKNKQSGSKTEANTKQNTSKTEAKTKQEASETEANVDVDVDVDVDKEVDVVENLVKKIKTEIDFHKALDKYEPKYGFAMINAFCNYWTETDQKGKMRFQDQKFFDIAKRLATWHGKNQKNTTTSFPAENSTTWKPAHHKNIDFSNTIETK
jgi:hypothetical protein